MFDSLSPLWLQASTHGSRIFSTSQSFAQYGQSVGWAWKGPKEPKQPQTSTYARVSDRPSSRRPCQASNISESISKLAENRIDNNSIPRADVRSYIYVLEVIGRNRFGYRHWLDVSDNNLTLHRWLSTSISLDSIVQDSNFHHAPRDTVGFHSLKDGARSRFHWISPRRSESLPQMSGRVHVIRFMEIALEEIYKQDKILGEQWHEDERVRPCPQSTCIAAMENWYSADKAARKKSKKQLGQTATNCNNYINSSNPPTLPFNLWQNDSSWGSQTDDTSTGSCTSAHLTHPLGSLNGSWIIPWWYVSGMPPNQLF